MLLRAALAFATVTLAGCSLELRQSEKEIQNLLVEQAPLRTSRADFEEIAADKGWKLDRKNVHIVASGKPTYFRSNSECFGAGGVVVRAYLGEYSTIFSTSVEALWVFDQGGRLVETCVRKTTEGI